MKKYISKKLITLGLSASAALAGGYLILPYEGGIVNTKNEYVTYLDPVGIPTACFGRTGRDMYGNILKVGKTYTEQECITMLADDIRSFEKDVDRAVTVEYASPYQRAALISFTYNVGSGALRSSTLLSRLNAGDHKAACEQLTRWVYAQGKKLNGLVNRRMSEMQWCLGNVTDDVKVTFDDILLTTKEVIEAKENGVKEEKECNDGS